jgi:hypothetical protein
MSIPMQYSEFPKSGPMQHIHGDFVRITERRDEPGIAEEVRRWFHPRRGTIFEFKYSVLSVAGTNEKAFAIAPAGGCIIIEACK